MLCRIYNKKGKIEKYESVVGVMDHFSEENHEMKPEIKMYGHDDFRNEHQLYTDTSDSVPRLHTDSSCTEEHVLSPEVTCSKEVQSEIKWNELDPVAASFDFDMNLIMDNTNNNNMNMNMNMSAVVDDPFAPQVQYQMNQLSSHFDSYSFWNT